MRAMWIGSTDHVAVDRLTACELCGVRFTDDDHKDDHLNSCPKLPTFHKVGNLENQPSGEYNRYVPPPWPPHVNAYWRFIARPLESLPPPSPSLQDIVAHMLVSFVFLVPFPQSSSFRQCICVPESLSYFLLYCHSRTLYILLALVVHL